MSLDFVEESWILKNGHRRFVGELRYETAVIRDSQRHERLPLEQIPPGGVPADHIGRPMDAEVQQRHGGEA